MDTALPTPEGTGVSGGDDLRAAAKAMEEAAWREGIDPTGPLGVFVTAMRHAILIMAETGERHARGVIGSIQDARALTEGEVKKLRHTGEMASLALDQAKTAQAGSEVQRERVVGRFVESVVPQLVKAVGEAVVIRERDYNRRVQWGRAAGVGCLLLALVVGGNVWGSLQTAQVAEGARALERIKQCQAAPVKDTRTGNAFCRLQDLLAPA